MNEEIVGYHGTKKEYEKAIVQSGFKESKANRGHWLVRGIYFYGNIYYAIEWGIVNFSSQWNNYNNFISDCSVIQCFIDVDNFNIMDLNDPIGYIYYLKILEIVEQKFPDKIESIRNNGDVQIIQLLEEIEIKTGEKYISMFDIVVADYPKDIYKKKEGKRPGDFLPCIQKQICVKNSDAIKEIKAMKLDNSFIKSYFDTIIKNREENENEKQRRNIGKAARKNKKYTR